MKATIFQEEDYAEHRSKFWLKDEKGNVFYLEQMDENEQGYAYSVPPEAMKITDVNLL
jgi:hypothetical protein